MTYHSVPRDITQGAVTDGRHRQLDSLTTRSPAPMIWSMRRVGSSVRLYLRQNRARYHGIFRRLRYANGTVMRINLVLLMAVAFLPFPTKLMAQAIRDSNAERAAIVFYGISLFVSSALISALWGAIVRDRELLKPQISDQQIDAIALAATANTAGPPRRHRARDRRTQGGGARLPGDSCHRRLRARGDEATGTEPAQHASRQNRRPREDECRFNREPAVRSSRPERPTGAQGR